ncbi:hypothetical protein [Risungbinella massiliensis]|uniref:hypothetical protein n=1 Tax=Risungbinella massiliensis TaxID=1329796 RepID=UPI0005CBDC2C|nr:hypothetical protein [Risungbinella massiliensis]
MENQNVDKGGQVMKNAAKKLYRGLLFILFLAIMMLCTVLVLTFLADPQGMLETIKKAFGLNS